MFPTVPISYVVVRDDVGRRKEIMGLNGVDGSNGMQPYSLLRKKQPGISFLTDPLKLL